MANYYSQGDKSIADRLVQDYTFEIGFSSASKKPFDLKEFTGTENASLRTTANVRKVDLTQASGSVSGFSRRTITKIELSADINTNNVSGTFDCKFCGVILKRGDVPVELLSIEILQEEITSSSDLSVVHTYTFTYEV